MYDYWPILVWLVASIGFAAVSLLLPHFVAPRKRTSVKGMPYESGVDPIADARKPLDIKFYLIAILFLVFDVELLFIYPWAVALKGDGGLPADFKPIVLMVMLALLVTLAIAYVIAWRKGVFQWRQK
jgi:NADH-quinone oxidoreductase subunit A